MIVLSVTGAVVGGAVVVADVGDAADVVGVGAAVAAGADDAGADDGGGAAGRLVATAPEPHPTVANSAAANVSLVHCLPPTMSIPLTARAAAP